MGIKGHDSVAFLLVSAPVPIGQEVDWCLRVGLDWCGVKKTLPSLGMKPRNIRLITSRYTETNSVLSANFEITELKQKESAL